MCCIDCVFLLCKQKTAYEMRISDWSSDVCSSDLQDRDRTELLRDRIDQAFHRGTIGDVQHTTMTAMPRQPLTDRRGAGLAGRGDRKSVEEGKGVSVRVDLGGRRILKNKKSVTRRDRPA